MAINKLTGRGPGFKDLSGQKFGRLTVIALNHAVDCNTYWLCECKCGTTRVLGRRNLVSGNTISCGCYRREIVIQRNHAVLRGEQKRTRKIKSREHQTWSDAKARCYNPQCAEFHNYGGRGIGMCDEWRNSFAQFLADMGACPPGLTIERINNNGNYEKSNCRWATRAEQVRNRRTTIVVTHNGETLTLQEWAERTGLSVQTLVSRHKRGRPLFAPQKRFWKTGQESSNYRKLK